jgi:hypothetical protein
LNFIPLGTKESLDKMYGNHIVIMFSWKGDILYQQQVLLE